MPRYVCALYPFFSRTHLLFECEMNSTHTWSSHLLVSTQCPDCSAPVDRKLLVSCITGDLKRSRSQDVVQSMSGWLVQSSSVGSRNGSLAHPTSLAHALLVPPTHDEMDESSFVSSMRSHSALSLQPEMNTSTIL